MRWFPKAGYFKSTLNLESGYGWIEVEHIPTGWKLNKKLPLSMIFAETHSLLQYQRQTIADPNIKIFFSIEKKILYKDRYIA